MNRDLTTGKPAAVLWKFCLPLFGSMIFQQLYNIADSFVAGKFLGEEALAAVGNSYSITLIFLAFAFGCNIGCSVVVSRFFGAKKIGKVKTTVYTTLIAGAVLCAVLMIIGLSGSGLMMTLIQTPENIWDDSLAYLLIYIFGLPFVLFYNVATGVFSALGDSRTPFIFLTCSSLANIGVDILFVTVIPMGVPGVAWATFICQGVSCILALFFVLKRLRSMKTDEAVQIFSFPILKQIAVIAIPSILQQSFVSVGNIVIQGLINPYGSGVIAGYSSSIKLNNLVISSITTLSNGISNYASQNLGAGKIDRIRSGLRAGLILVWTICLPLVILYFFFGRYLVFLFLNQPSDDALSTGVEILQILSPFYFVVGTKLACDGVLRGTGQMKKFMFTTFTDLLLRVGLAFLLSCFFGSLGIWMSWPFGWIVATILSAVMYKITKWERFIQKPDTT